MGNHQIATCRVPACEWQRRCDLFETADRVLGEHLVSGHTQRELADLLLALWQGGEERGRGIVPEAVDAAQWLAQAVPPASKVVARVGRPLDIATPKAKRSGGRGGRIAAPECARCLTDAVPGSSARALILAALTHGSHRYGSLQRTVQRARGGSVNLAAVTLVNLRKSGDIESLGGGLWQLSAQGRKAAR